MKIKFILEILPRQNTLFIHKWGISFYYKNTWVFYSFRQKETSIFLHSLWSPAAQLSFFRLFQGLSLCPLIKGRPFSCLARIFVVIGNPEDTAEYLSHTFHVGISCGYFPFISFFFRLLLIFQQAHRKLVFLISLSFSQAGLKLTNKS